MQQFTKRETVRFVLQHFKIVHQSNIQFLNSRKGKKSCNEIASMHHLPLSKKKEMICLFKACIVIECNTTTAIKSKFWIECFTRLWNNFKIKLVMMILKSNYFPAVIVWIVYDWWVTTFEMIPSEIAWVIRITPADCILLYFTRFRCWWWCSLTHGVRITQTNMNEKHVRKISCWTATVRTVIWHAVAGCAFPFDKTISNMFIAPTIPVCILPREEITDPIPCLLVTIELPVMTFTAFFTRLTIAVEFDAFFRGFFFFLV